MKFNFEGYNRNDTNQAKKALLLDASMYFHHTSMYFHLYFKIFQLDKIARFLPRIQPIICVYKNVIIDF